LNNPKKLKLVLITTYTEAQVSARNMKTD